MQAFLTRLTFAVVGAVVVVLAGYLILIAAALIKANQNLTRLVSGLEQIRNNTEPLAADLTAINGAAVALRDKLVSVDHNLQSIIQLVRG